MSETCSTPEPGTQRKREGERVRERGREEGKGERVGGRMTSFNI